MTRLEKGVLVRCCNARATGGVLVEGFQYKVTAVDYNPDAVMLFGLPRWWMMGRFELVSVPVTPAKVEPKPIDWSKPVRMVGYPDAKWRVLCTDAPGNTPVRVMLVKGQAAGFVPGGVFSREIDGTVYTARPEHAFENVPVEPVVSKRVGFLDDKLHLCLFPTHYTMETARQQAKKYKARALQEIIITEGEGL